MCFWQILENILRAIQALVVLGFLIWLFLVWRYYRHRTEQYWYRRKFLPKELRDELYKLNPLNVTDKLGVNPRVLIHGLAFKKAVNKKPGEEGKLTFNSENSSLLTCKFIAYQTVVKGTHEEDKENIHVSRNGLTGLLSKIYGDTFSKVLSGELHFYAKNKNKEKGAYFIFTGNDIVNIIKWNVTNCDICFLERVGMLVLIGKHEQNNIQFFFRCLPMKFYYNRLGCGNKIVLRFNSRLFIYILRFYSWEGKFFTNYLALKEYYEKKAKE